MWCALIQQFHAGWLWPSDLFHSLDSFETLYLRNYRSDATRRWRFSTLVFPFLRTDLSRSEREVTIAYRRRRSCMMALLKVSWSYFWSVSLGSASQTFSLSLLKSLRVSKIYALITFSFHSVQRSHFSNVSKELRVIKLKVSKTWWGLCFHIKGINFSESV